MAKSSRPERKRSDRRRREPTEYEEVTLSVDRVTRVVKGGRRMRFRAVVVIGNKKGKVGLGTGKATEVQAAVHKATSDARRNMIRVPIVKGTIPHEVNLKFKAAKIRLIPAAEGTGIIAGGALRVILEQAGVQNILSKRYGTTNKLVNAQATIFALGRLHGELPPEQEGPKMKGGDALGPSDKKALREKSNKELGLQETPELEQLAVKEVTREEAGLNEQEHGILNL